MRQITSTVTSNLYVCCNHLCIPVGCQLWLGFEEGKARKDPQDVPRLTSENASLSLKIHSCVWQGEYSTIRLTPYSSPGCSSGILNLHARQSSPPFFPKPDSYVSRDLKKQAQSGYSVNRLIPDLLNTDSNSSLLS